MRLAEQRTGRSNRRSPRVYRLGCALGRSRAASVALTLLSAGCSTSIGAAGAYGVHPGPLTSLGIKTRTTVNLGLFDARANLAVGTESAVLQRLTGSGNAWGEWRLQGLLGIMHMPRPQESAVGYEALLAVGPSRYYVNTRASFGLAWGVTLGLPVRLGGSAPAWRADDLAALSAYVVPELGFTALDLAGRLEATAGLSIRLHLWSAIAP